MAISPALTERLAKLARLGAQVDERAAAWLGGSSVVESDSALHSMDEARRLLELTVDLAVSEGVAQSPALTAMRAEWEARFARLAVAVQARQRTLTAEARLRSQQNHAAQEYLRHA
ncbi:hypothetical protein [Halothiobacillus sp. DCM-1]|uniref:hypothetical protein n=1 Tax=Halothiobacillus sp. DCM-1 TaxID=3112558 RepID=UPI00324A81F8